VAAERVAIVTGGNRGIGLEICRQLARAGIRVLLTARDAAKGKAACRPLTDAGLPVSFHKLDVTSARSIDALAAFAATKFGRVDILVNNAGVMFDARGTRFLDSKIETYRDTLETNTLGPLRVTQALLPQMMKRNYGRVVNLSSGLGQLSGMGGGTPAYRISKTALNAVTRIVAAEAEGTNVLVNAACPGWVRTDMGGAAAPLSAAQGADTAVWLATLPDDGPSGGYFRGRKPIPW
jgi:NAD(P)-dependent dehydrogenase (short-subunit alcohol dehydrogenase family)